MIRCPLLDSSNFLELSKRAWLPALWLYDH